VTPWTIVELIACLLRLLSVIMQCTCNAESYHLEYINAVLLLLCWTWLLLKLLTLSHQ